MTSLIQQRLALGRIRVRALWALWVGGIGVTLGLVLLVSGGTSTFAIGWVLCFIYGLTEMARYRQKVRAFESEHGADAGKQN